MSVSPRDIRPLRGLHRVAFPFASWYAILVTASGAVCSLIAL